MPSEKPQDTGKVNELCLKRDTMKLQKLEKVVKNPTVAKIEEEINDSKGYRFQKEREENLLIDSLLDESEYILQMMNTSLHRCRPALVPGTLPIFDTGSQRFTVQVSGRLQSCIT